MIRVEHLSKSFTGDQVLSDINLEFSPSKINIIIGQSGSGKTVLMRCMVGLLDVTGGKIYYDDRELKYIDGEDCDKDLLKEVGMIFQGSALFDSMSVEDNLIFPLRMFTKEPMDTIRDKANEMLQKVGLSNANNKFPSEISGGMKRRVAIARAVILRPKYLFCDEPNSGLDPYMSSVIDDLLFDITKEYQMTTIINTHDMNTVLEKGEHITFINKGQVAWQGTSEEVYRTDNKDINNYIFCNGSFKKLQNSSNFK